MYDENENKKNENTLNNQQESKNSYHEGDQDNYSISEGSDYPYSNSYYQETQNKQNEDYYYSTENLTAAAGESKKPKKKKSFASKVAKSVVISLVVGCVGGASFAGANYVTSSLLPDQEVEAVQIPTTSTTTNTTDEDTTDTAITASTVSTSSTDDISQVVSNVMPSIVAITSLATEEVSIPSWFGQQGDTEEYEYESAGSGIIIGENDTELLIVTNNHVIVDAKTITVTCVDDNTYTAQVKGTDSDMDLAVLAVELSDIESDTLSQIKVAELGSSEDLQVGETAIAIGNALGYGQSVTTGVISAVNREVTVDDTTNTLIQTDAAINPGNSGGALLNMQGQVIGINSMKFSDTDVEGMGYAIPISSAEPIINSLMTQETKVKVDDAEVGYIGIAGSAVTNEEVEKYNIPTGVYIEQVAEDSAASEAGLQKGDIITGFDGNSVESMSDLQDLLQYYEAGTTVDITISSSENGAYTERTVSITLGTKPTETESQQSQQLQP